MSELQVERLTPIVKSNGWGLAAGRSGVRAQAAGADDLGPRSIGGVLDRGFAIFREHFAFLLGIGFVIGLPVRMFFFFGYRDMVQLDWSFMFMIGCTSAGSAVVGAVCARTFGAHIAGAKVSLRTVLGMRPAEVVGLMAISLTVGIFTGLGLCFFVVGAFLASWLLALAPTIYVLEFVHKPIARVSYSLRRSVSLVTGSFWRWSGMAVVAWLIIMCMNLPLSVLEETGLRTGYALDWGIPVLWLDWFVCLAGALFQALTSCLIGCIYASFYFDQRARLEGVDLYLELAALGEEAA